MTQFPYDQFIKDYIPKLLGDYGEATSAVELAVEVKEIDVLFIPNQPVPTDILGLLGEIAQKACLQQFETKYNSKPRGGACAPHGF